MVRLLISIALNVAAAAVGLIVAAAVLDEMTLDVTSFIVSVVVFAVLSAVLGPFILKLAVGSMQALMGAVGLVTTFVSLVLTDLLTDGLDISGVSTWVLASLIVWLSTLVATILLPLVLVRAGVEALREHRR